MLHISPLGLLRPAPDNIQRFTKLNSILNCIQDSGGNIAIPAYSYSYTKNETYDIRSTPSTLDETHEFLRKNNINKRG